MAFASDGGVWQARHPASTPRECSPQDAPTAPIACHQHPHTTPSAGLAWPDSVASFEASELFALLCAHGGEVPPDRLAAISLKIESFGSQKAPGTLSQRRVFVRDWMERQRRDASAAHGEPHDTSSPADRPAASSQSPVTPKGLASHSGFCGKAMTGANISPSEGISAEAAELATRIGRLVEPSGKLHIPPELVPTLTSDVTLALGKSRTPPSLSARRRLIEDWYIATVRKASAPGDEAVQRAALTNPFSMPAANLKGPYASPQSVQLSPSRGAMLDESSEFRMTARLSNINEHESAINSGTHSPMGSPVGSPFAGTQLWAAPAEDAASVGMAEPASTLFGCLKSPETSVQQVLVPVFAESDLEGVASHISALTGAKPRSSMPGDLHTFVCDWYRWQAHLERSNVSCARRGEPSRAASHECKQPGVPLGNRDSSAVRRPQTAPPAPRSTQVHEIEEEPEMTEKQLVEELLSSTRRREHPESDGTKGSGEVELNMTSRRLAVIARQIELRSGKRAPKLQTQKRDFVLSWLRLALDRQQHTERLQSGSPPERATPAKRIDQNPISSYEPLRSYFNNRSIAEALCALLGEYGQPQADGSGKSSLNVPLDRLSIVVEQESC